MSPPDSPGFAVYVHVPFCEQKCTYCDFFTVTDPDHPLAARWMELAARELELWAEAGDIAPGGPVHSVFLGGGTPSLLPPASVAAFLHILGARFGLVPDAEVTLETQPGTADTARIQEFAEAGINRFSVGVQTFDPELLARTGRRHSVEMTRQVLRGAAATGRVLSLDLIAALPGQTLDAWRRELEEALSFHPAHISVYELTFHPGTRWYRDLRAGRLSEADEDLRIAMFEEAERVLIPAGFEHYEISNYARPGRRSRHNETYWRLGNYIGLGAGAHSLVWPDRWHNPGNAGAWAAAIDSGHLYRHASNPDDPDVFVAENLAMALRLLEGVDLDWFARKVGSDLRTGRRAERLRELESAGLVTLEGSRLRLTAEGRLRADLISDFLL